MSKIVLSRDDIIAMLVLAADADPDKYNYKVKSVIYRARALQETVLGEGIVDVQIEAH